jgi:hypothetical protein
MPLNLTKIISYCDFPLFIRILFFSFKIDLTPDKKLAHLVDCGISKNLVAENKLRRYVNLCWRVRHLLGFRDRCLKQAVLLCYFLRRQGIDSRLYFALKKEDGLLKGHCWQEIGNATALPDWEIVSNYP